MRTPSSQRDRTPPLRALPSGAGRWRGSAGLLLLLLAGCDLREIAAPNPVAIPHGPAPRHEAAPVLLGTYSTPVEVAAVPGAVTTRQPAQPAALPPLPANSYVLLRVSGRVRLVSGPWWPGPARPIATYTAVQTTQATGRAQTRVWIRGGAETAPPAGGYEPRFSPAPDGEDRIVLVRTGAVPAELWTGRDQGGHRITATEGWCTGAHWCSPTEIVMGGTWADRLEIEAYHVAESNTVTATHVPEPLHVDAPESVAPGQPVTMSARTWGGLRLRHPQVDTADVEWYWYPGDTGAVPNPATAAQRIGCNLKVCTFTPGGEGRIRVVTYVERARVERSEIVRVQTARPKLTCTPAVTRGEEAVCTAATDPAGAAGELTVVQWSFGGRPRTDGERTSRTWSGIMVESGDVVLQARIGNGSVITERARVTVQSRGWTDHLPPARVELKSCQRRTRTCPQARMEQERDPGITYLPMDEIDVSRLAVGAVVEGPNTGWWYVAGDEPPVRLPSPVTRLNPGIFDPKNALYRSAHDCRPQDVQSWITRHENTHVVIGQERAAEGYVNGELERLTAYRGVNDTRFFDQMVAVMRVRVTSLLDDDHTLKDRYPPAPCALGLNPNTRN